jgi:hypothetical protein
VSLRFAMVQDVLTERFARHGRAYYAERNRRAREELARLEAGDRAFALTDDLGAGLDHLGEHDEAVRLLRDKLAKQTERRLRSGRDYYTTYANLGTFLIHGNFRAAITGDAVAKERLREGLGFIRQAIEVNPEAHFGREQWQAAAVEFLLAVLDRPELLRTFDLVGNRLDAAIDPRARRAYREESGWVGGGGARVAAQAIRAGTLEPGEALALRRDGITLVGAEGGWPADRIPSHPKPVPFDEPVLGIIGMWRQGGGANPHFALCLGESMLRVGQRYLAWSAYERAAKLAERFWPDPDLQQFLRDHCRARQKLIEGQLPAAEVADLRPRFEGELGYGQQYRDVYQQYEADRIAEGRSIEDPHFYDAFHAAWPPIASPVGPEDEFRVTNDLAWLRGPWVGWRAGLALLGAGVGSFAAACGMRYRRRHNRAVVE